eukprot:1467802-Amphidinium_carterae.1
MISVYIYNGIVSFSSTYDSVLSQEVALTLLTCVSVCARARRGCVCVKCVFVCVLRGLQGLPYRAQLRDIEAVDKKPCATINTYSVLHDLETSLLPYFKS